MQAFISIRFICGGVVAKNKNVRKLAAKVQSVAVQHIDVRGSIVRAQLLVACPASSKMLLGFLCLPLD